MHRCFLRPTTAHLVVAATTATLDMARTTVPAFNELNNELTAPFVTAFVTPNIVLIRTPVHMTA